LIHDNRTVSLNRMFDELCRKAANSSAEQVAHDIVYTAQAIQNVLSDSDEIQHPARGLFVLALQQVVDSFIAGLLTDEAFEWDNKTERIRSCPRAPTQWTVCSERNERMVH
jgi:hypothetical protein